MKSHRSAGQHTLNGKKHKTLGCGCCTVSDLREKHAKQYEHKDMQERLADTEKSMTDKELIAMAQEAGFPIVTLLSGNVLIAGNAKRRFRRLVELAQEAEREACIAEIDAANNCECGAPCNCFGASLAKLVITLRSNVRNERPEASAACAGSRSIEVLGSGGNHET